MESTNRVLKWINLILFGLIFFFSLTLYNIVPFNFINIAFVALFLGITIIYAIINGVKPKLNIFYIATFGLILLMLLSFLVNISNGFPRTPILMSIMSLFIFLWFDLNQENIESYFIAMLIASELFLITFLITEFQGVIHPNFSKRVGDTLGNLNDIARHLVFAFIINVYFINPRKHKILSIIATFGALFALYFVILTGSISNMLISFVLIIFYILSLMKKKHRGYALIGLVIFIAITMIVLFTVPSLTTIKNRILSIFATLVGSNKYKSDASALERSRAAIYGFRLLLESPLLGNGYSSVVKNYVAMAHNNFAEIGADYGIFALILEELIILYPLFNRKRANKNNVLFIKLVSFYIFLVQFVLVVFNSKIESILLPIIFVLSRPKPIENLSLKPFKNKPNKYCEVTV